MGSINDSVPNIMCCFCYSFLTYISFLLHEIMMIKMGIEQMVSPLFAIRHFVSEWASDLRESEKSNPRDSHSLWDRILGPVTHLFLTEHSDCLRCHLWDTQYVSVTCSHMRHSNQSIVSLGHLWNRAIICLNHSFAYELVTTLWVPRPPEWLGSINLTNSVKSYERNHDYHSLRDESKLIF